MRSVASALLAIVLLTRPVGAHVPMIRGHLVDLAQRAEQIVLARVTSAVQRPAGDSRLELQAQSTLRGPRSRRTFAILSPGHLAKGQYLFFLGKGPSGLESLAPRGVVFPVGSADEPSYRRVVFRLTAAFGKPEPERTDAIRNALIESLTSPSAELRHHAGLELVGLADSGHPPTAEEAGRLRKIQSETSDTALQGLIATLLRPVATLSPQAPPPP